MMDAAAFVRALRDGDESAIASALGGDPSLARARDAQGVSVVCLSVYLGRESIARRLCALRDDLDVFEASTVGDLARVRALLDAQPVLVNAYSPDGFHPLGYACFFGRPNVATLLLARGADVEAASRNAMQVRPLHSAVAQSDPATALRLARALLDAGAKPSVAQQRGFTALHEAALRGHAALVQLLLDHGADPSARNADGQSPGDCARAAGHAEVARLLAPIGALATIRVFVRDLAEARAFFAEVVGLPPLLADATLPIASFDTGATTLVLESVEPGDAEGEALIGRFTGISFASDDVVAAYEALTRRGVRFREPPEKQPWGGIMAHFEDPSGNVYTILQRPGATARD
jgi:catechol 2,3-dioxygenase-like lactoylglutathione lyase family enzyme